MLVNQKYDSGFQSEFYRNIEKALTDQIKTEKPGESALKKVLQFAGSFEVLHCQTVGPIEISFN